MRHETPSRTRQPWQRFLPHYYWLLLSAAILLAVIGMSVVRLWRAGVVGDWAIFVYGLVAVVFLAVAVTTLITFRPDQL